MSNSKTLFFVNNANSGLLNLTLDSIHKILSPKTYSCNLCSITHGYFGELKAWKDFTEQCNYTIEYFHKDEWKELYPEFNNKTRNQFPAVYICSNGGLKEIISSEALQGMQLNDLISKVNALKL